MLTNEYLDILENYMNLSEEDIYFLISWAQFGIMKTHESNRRKVSKKYNIILEKLYSSGIKVYGWQFEDKGIDSNKIVFGW